MEAQQPTLDIPPIPYEESNRDHDARKADTISEVVPITKGDKMARDGSVGEATYEAVNKLTEAGMKRSEAFEQVAKDMGAKPGTTAANYYRVARASGKTTGKRGRPKGSTSTSTPRAPRSAPTASRSNGDAGALAAELTGLIQAMVDRAVDERFTRLLNR